MSEEAERAREGMSEQIPDSVAESILKGLWVVAGSAASAAGVVMGYFRKHRMALEAKITELDTRTNDHILSVEKVSKEQSSSLSTEMNSYYESQASHDGDIRVLQSEQRNMAGWVRDIQKSTHDTNSKIDALSASTSSKIDALSDKLTDVLIEMKRH